VLADSADRSILNAVIPIQDAVPSGKVPIVTIAFIIINLGWFATESSAAAASLPLAQTAFSNATAGQLFLNLLFLWLFGDNVEARLGRPLFTLLYLVCSFAGAYTAARSGGHATLHIGATCAVSGVLGAYFVLLPKARVLMLVPLPAVVTEAPALFFLALWWMLQLATFVASTGTEVSRLSAPAASFATGAVICFVSRRPVVWS
jgi:membrane associated rhomboid family serine protease